MDKKLKSVLSFLDCIYIKHITEKNLSKYLNNVKQIHNKKLSNLGISKFQHSDNPDKYIFNLSDYNLSFKEKNILSLGLDFCLPCFKPNSVQLYLSFECLMNSLINLPSKDNLEYARKKLQDLANSTLQKIKKCNSWLPFFKKCDLDTLKKLSSNRNLIICKPDKGRGIVLMNRTDYINKMNHILEDNTKFKIINEDPFKLSIRLQDKSNRFISVLKENEIINDSTYKTLYTSGSSLGQLYGLPKIHKQNIPLRPIVATYNTANY